MAGSPQTLQLAHPPSLPPPPLPHAPASSWPAAWSGAALSLGTQMAGQTSIDARRAMSSFHHHSSSIGSSSPQLLPSSSASSSSSSSSTFPIVYNPPSQSQPLSQSHLSMSAAAAAASSAAAAGSDSLHHLQDDYHPLDFPFDAHDLPTGHSFSGDLFPASHSSSFWSPADNKLAPLSPISVKREPAQLYSPERVPQSISGRFYESSARFDDAPQAYTHLQHHQQQQQQQHQPHSNPQHHQSSHQATSTPANADYASADLSPLQAHHVFYAADAHDPAEFPPEHRQHHRRHPSSGSVVPADFFAPTYIEPSELDYASPSAMQLQQHNQYDDQQQQQQQHQQQQNQQQQIGQAQVNGVPFPTADTPSPPEYGSSPGLTEDADDSVESDGGEYDDGEYDLLDPASGVQRRRRRRSTMSTSGYSDASGPLARRRRTSRVAAPVPVPNLTKKSRGRRVPTAPVIVNQGGVQKDLRTYCCVVSGCGKRFARGEHLKRHVRSIHTNEKPHKCPAPGCGKEFSRHDNLGQHMRVHKTFPRNEY